MVEIKIIEKTENKLLHRTEIKFTIDHFGAGSPERFEVKEKLAAMETANAELTFIKQMKGEFGLPHIQGEAFIYDDEEIAKKLEPIYMKVRNVPKDQRKDLRKQLKGKKSKK